MTQYYLVQCGLPCITVRVVPSDEWLHCTDNLEHYGPEGVTGCALHGARPPCPIRGVHADLAGRVVVLMYKTQGRDIIQAESGVLALNIRLGWDRQEEGIWKIGQTDQDSPVIQSLGVSRLCVLQCVLCAVAGGWDPDMTGNVWIPAPQSSWPVHSPTARVCLSAPAV